ncbi:hypothetical protein Pmani_008019 [Petrolisthes manimaculis]|uniref:Major facilitator superfamily (MFS) profile domain-containing protein n=1 Tax=Petrolisthes manimaculis TaxID=1843537 RepID=A0AAE1Q6A0_9EUCA|nr:hypothetical protein Pmani_008019 [Petrolisthes manimaculis]
MWVTDKRVTPTLHVTKGVTNSSTRNNMSTTDHTNTTKNTNCKTSSIPGNNNDMNCKEKSSNNVSKTSCRSPSQESESDGQGTVDTTDTTTSTPHTTTACMSKSSNVTKSTSHNTNVAAGCTSSNTVSDFKTTACVPKCSSRSDKTINTDCSTSNTTPITTTTTRCGSKSNNVNTNVCRSTLNATTLCNANTNAKATHCDCTTTPSQKTGQKCRGCEARRALRSIKATTKAKKKDNEKEGVSAVLVILAIVLAISGFLSSFEQSVVGVAIFFMRQDVPLTTHWHQLIVGSFYISGYIFSLVSGFASERFGRRAVVRMSSTIYIVAAIVIASSYAPFQLVIGRVLAGISLGLSATVVPVYLSEIAPTSSRGRVSLSYALFYVFGQLLATLLGGTFGPLHNGWRYLVGLASVPALIQFLALMMLPDSPRWLANKGRVEEARASLQQLRPRGSAWEAEFQSILCNARANAGKGGIKQIFASINLRRALLVGSLLHLAFATTGIIVFLAYSGSLVLMTGVSKGRNAIYLVSGVVSVGLLGLTVGILLVEKVGRRPLVLASLAGVVLGLLITAATLNAAHIKSASVTLAAVDPACDFDTCGECTHRYHCGFCYNSTDAACVPADVLAYNELAEVGPCSDPMLLQAGDYTFADNYCPFSAAWVIILGFCIFVFWFALGMGPLPWTINSEIFPIWARSIATSLTTSVNWLSNLLLTISFLYLTRLIYKHGVFYVLAGLSTIWFIVFLFILPETGGRSLEQNKKLFQRPLGQGVLVGKKSR